MKSLSCRLVCLLIIGLSIVDMTTAQVNQLQVQSMNNNLDNTGLAGSFNLNINTSTLTNPRLNLLLYKNSILTKSDTSLPILLQGNTLAFSIPSDKLTDNEEVDIWIQDGGASKRESPRYRINLKLSRDLFEAIKQKEKAESDLKEERQKNIDLTNRVIPSVVNLLDSPLATDSQVFLRFQTTSNGKPSSGKIKAVVKRSDGTVADTHVSDNLQVDHPVVFSKLTEGQTYNVEVVVLNHLAGDAPQNATLKTLNQEPRLGSIKTLNDIRSPIFSKLNVTSSDEKTIVADVALDQADAFLQVNLEELVDPTALKYKLVDTRGKVGTDDSKRPIGEIVSKTPYTFSGLKPATTYKLTFSGQNRFGKSTNPSQEIRQVMTKELPPAFEFSGSVKLVINPLDFTATWEATSKPAGGSFDVIFPSGTVTSKAADITGNALKASLDVAGLRTVLDKSKGTEQPNLRFTMRNEQGVTKTVLLNVATVIPKEAEVKASTLLTKDEKDKLLKVIKSTTDVNKKFNWQELLSTGLGILFSML